MITKTPPGGLIISPPASRKWFNSILIPEGRDEGYRRGDFWHSRAIMRVHRRDLGKPLRSSQKTYPRAYPERTVGGVKFEIIPAIHQGSVFGDPSKRLGLERKGVTLEKFVQIVEDRDSRYLRAGRITKTPRRRSLILSPPGRGNGFPPGRDVEHTIYSFYAKGRLNNYLKR